MAGLFWGGWKDQTRHLLMGTSNWISSGRSNSKCLLLPGGRRASRPSLDKERGGHDHRLSGGGHSLYQVVVSVVSFSDGIPSVSSYSIVAPFSQDQSRRPPPGRDGPSRHWRTQLAVSPLQFALFLHIAYPEDGCPSPFLLPQHYLLQLLPHSAVSLETPSSVSHFQSRVLFSDTLPFKFPRNQTL